LLGDQLGQEGKNEREAIGHLRQAIDNAGNLARVTNGCHVPCSWHETYLR
jgi:hypothetical protein